MASVLVVVFGSPNTIKMYLQNNRAYARYVPSLIEENKKLQQNSNNIALQDPAITQLLTDSFKSADLQNKTEYFLDRIYAWLSGDAPNLTFTIDFTANKRFFADKLAEYAFTRFSALPVCKVNPLEIDPLTATCRPKNIDLDGSQQAYDDQIFTSDAIMKKTVYTELDLPKNTQGQTIADQLYYAPSAYKWIMRAPYILAVASVLLALDFILLSTRKRKGVKSLAGILMGSGISIMIFPLVFDYLLPYFAKSYSFSFETGGTQQILNEITNQISHYMDLLFIITGASMATAGFMLWAAERLTRPQNKYHNIGKKSGIAVSSIKVAPPNKNKITADTVPVQTSDGPRKKVKVSPKYRTLNKKEF